MVVLSLALPTPLRRLFDYLPPQGIDTSTLVPGVRVKVPFGSRTMIGILIEVKSTTTIAKEKLKKAIEILDSDSILSKDIFKLCEWAALYYHAPLGEVVSAAMPVRLRKGEMVSSVPRRPAVPDLSIRAQACPRDPEQPQALQLNPGQQAAVDAITQAQNQFKTFLLDGVTGSGKTEVYLRAIANIIRRPSLPLTRRPAACPRGPERPEKELDPADKPRDDKHVAASDNENSGKQVLVLVPEISLTPQTIERFQSRFDVPVVAMHSSMTDKKRLAAWEQARSGEARIVIGTRSAIFTPFQNLGLIIIDEEHDASFKQQDRFRYHARDLAVMRAQMNSIPVVLGSATPSLESLLNAKRERYEFLRLPERAGNAVMPDIHLVDMQQSKAEEGLSPALLQAVREQLENNNQVMLFLNRRGFAPVYYCTQCNEIVGCKRCDAKMVYHQKANCLQCHHCDARRAIPKKCGECGEQAMQPVGFGTERLEEVLANYFPDVPLIRVDRDTTRRKGELHSLLKRIHEEPKAILLGTQMLAKGHHFPNVTLVGILDVDQGLFSADFRAAENMGQLILQVAGRAGRADKKGVVLIQTRHSEHPLLEKLIQEGYAAFADKLLTEREQAGLPPYAYFAVVRAEAHQESKVENFLSYLRDLVSSKPAGLSLMGPVPALMAKRKGKHCQNLLIRSNQRMSLQQFLSNLLLQMDEGQKRQTVKWTLDVDPLEVL